MTSPNVRMSTRVKQGTVRGGAGEGYYSSWAPRKLEALCKTTGDKPEQGIFKENESRRQRPHPHENATRTQNWDGEMD